MTSGSIASAYSYHKVDRRYTSRRAHGKSRYGRYLKRLDRAASRREGKEVAREIE